MLSVVGVNEISLEVIKRLNVSYIVGPYVYTISDKHINEGISYLNLPYIIPKQTNIVIDLTLNRISSLMISDFAIKENKALVSLILYQDSVIVKNVRKNSCVRCLSENTNSISNYLLIKDRIPSNDVVSELISKSIETGKSYLITGGDIEEFVFEKGCGSCRDRDYVFLSGEYGEMVNENCNDNSSIVFPIDDRDIDIRYLSQLFVKNGIKILEETDDYVSFAFEDKNMFLFRNGRLMISNVKSKQEAEYIYRIYVGS
ncbi:MAG: hypothetical protein RMJ37_02820 [Spirochaetia bacterium]|nr:hypothetical protein [Spirochaetota bacterium]MCX8095905.1 hypothetical protein [Spirochaetota bacterium]MDW8112259.1 hypothetical protein [Spirochaetia bacterium]